LGEINQALMGYFWLFILLVPLIWYAFVLLSLKRAPSIKPPEFSEKKLPFISVIIPFRNESRWLPDLIQSLKDQNFPRESWELIMIDDHSLDSGPAMVSQFLNAFEPANRLIRLQEGQGKKEALAKGVEHARSEWILATDADCIFGKDWLRSYARIIASHEVSMICGPVKFKNGSNSVLALFQRFEQAILMHICKASIASERAILANGANMAFKRTHFSKADLKKEQTASGDDIFLLHHIKQTDPSQITFNDQAEALVSTPLKRSLVRFLDQRIRWASKGRFYQDRDSLRYGFAITLANVGLMIVLVAVLFGWIDSWILLIGVVFKFIIDSILFSRAKAFSDLPSPYFNFLWIFLTYPFYVIGIALLSLLYKPRWKGRKI